MVNFGTGGKSLFFTERAGNIAATRTKTLENADEDRAVLDASSSKILIWNVYPNSVMRKLGFRFHFLPSCASHPKLLFASFSLSTTSRLSV